MNPPAGKPAPTASAIFEVIGIGNIVMGALCMLIMLYCHLHLRSKMIRDDRYIKAKIFERVLFPFKFLVEELKKRNRLMTAYVAAQALWFLLLVRIAFRLFAG